MPMIFNITIDALFLQDELTEAQCIALQLALAKDPHLVDILLQGGGSATLQIQIPDGQPELDMAFKQAVAQLPDDLSIVEFMKSTVFVCYHNVLDKNKSLVLTSSFRLASHNGWTTLKSLRNANKGLLAASRQMGDVRVGFLSWLFDIK